MMTSDARGAPGGRATDRATSQGRGAATASQQNTNTTPVSQNDRMPAIGSFPCLGVFCTSVVDLGSRVPSRTRSLSKPACGYHGRRHVRTLAYDRRG